MTFNACSRVCHDALSLLASTGEDLLGLMLCVSDRLFGGLLSKLQDVGRSSGLE
jgi:hypothetical protein